MNRLRLQAMLHRKRTTGSRGVGSAGAFAHLLERIWPFLLAEETPSSNDEVTNGTSNCKDHRASPKYGCESRHSNHRNCEWRRIHPTKSSSISLASVSSSVKTAPSFPATRLGTNWNNWKATRNAPAGVIGGSTLKITATLVGRSRPTGHSNDWEPLDIFVSVTVRLETTPPVVTIDPYTPEVTPASLPYRRDAGRFGTR